MLALRYILDSFAVTGPLNSKLMADAVASGFKTVINFRPDGEAEGQESSEEVAASAEALGLDYVHIPASKLALFDDELVLATWDALSRREGPILATCASGQRAAILWGAVHARSLPVDTVLGILSGAGFDFECLREEFEEQSGLGNLDNEREAA